MPSSDADSLQARMVSAKIGPHFPLPSVLLTREHITGALKKSTDNGATLDLAHKSLTDVGEDGAAALANIGQRLEGDMHDKVSRIALSHNRLATLPMAFALLSHLRYLSLKGNSFTVFPDLTIMPNLEILDLSRNKIKRFPSQPGNLTKLRVFSISRNKIHKIPPYFVQFRSLTMFKADQNPLEWPPKDVMDPPSSDKDVVVKNWIRRVQSWIDENSNSNDARLVDEPSYIDEDNDTVLDTILDYTRDDNMDSQSAIDQSLDFDVSPTHQRSFSHASDASMYSEEALPQPGPSMTRSPRSPRPPRLHLDAISSSSRGITKSSSPARSPESYLPTPDESVSSNEDESTQSTARQQGRNVPFAPGVFGASRRDALSQKSLPNLRPTKHRRGQSKDMPDGHADHFSIPSPPHRQESDSSTASLANFRLGKVLNHDSVVASPVSLHQTAPPMDVERNSYFRRFSALTPTLSKAIPPQLLALIDAVRGILFSVCQIYQSLQHYTVYAIDERLSAVLLKVLQPATTCMTQLIQALDRFDSISRRTLPSSAVCRTVVETCRENVMVFGKAVGVLSLQLKVIATSDDARYTRQMLLVLYGATAEISNAWRSTASQIDAVKPFLSHHRPSPMRANQVTASGLASATYPPLSAPVGSFHLPTQISPALRPHMRTNSSGLADGKVRLNRRHAGSFSYKDVEIGKMLPSHMEEPLPFAGAPATPSFTTSSPVVRGGRRPSAVSNGMTHHDGTIRPSTSTPRWDSHSRQSSASSFLASATSSPSVPHHRPPALDMGPAATWIDKEAIDAVKAAVEAAPVVWDMTDEMLLDDPTMRAELQGRLNMAREVTQRLRENIRLLNSGHAAADRIAIRDDAHVFAKVVAQLLSAIKAFGSTHPLSPALRGHMVTLTNATQEFVMLLHVSSFSPAPTPRPYSPMVGFTTPQSAMAPIAEDDRLPSSFSRGRGAAPFVSSKLATPSKDPQRSALSHHGFAI
ncbi:hypothetical protein PHLGIDRAFT_389074 [Phlebiopsis gigantea 11061_1 CR5-6]|uniref:RAM signaling network component n=1 Tax=Phlebiopsis gigantea (strain 11061_1 CR5-6) TaxID=745531 RepID=A0A0C3SBP3_PHLG1|nr:hypothetical protein PHLGIDRAFT_389074 [Phlebiopsis gigantea 11061_1 CR5-6]